MPYVAKYEGEVAGAWEVPFQTDATCLECGGRLRIWRESDKSGPRRFQHVENMGGGSGGGTAACESVGESHKHAKWKNFAAETLATVFDVEGDRAVVELTLGAPVSDKTERKADAAVTFAEPDPKLGRGVIVEVQYKNKTKDVDETTADYLEQGYSVVWTSEEDYTPDECLLTELDIRLRAFQAAWPEHVPPTSEWSACVEDGVLPLNDDLCEELHSDLNVGAVFDTEALVVPELLETFQYKQRGINSLLKPGLEDVIQPDERSVVVPVHIPEQELMGLTPDTELGVGVGYSCKECAYSGRYYTRSVENGREQQASCPHCRGQLQLDLQ